MQDEIRRDPEIDRTTSTSSSPGTTGRARARLAPLKDLNDLEVAEGDPDVRGWTVKADGEQKIGKVDDLIVDPDAMKVRYLVVELDKDAVGASDDRLVLVPIGNARLYEDTDDVRLNVPAASLATMPLYDKDRLSDPAYQGSIQSGYGITGTSDTLYDTSPAYDDEQFFGGRRQGRERDPYFVRGRQSGR